MITLCSGITYLWARKRLNGLSLNCLISAISATTGHDTGQDTGHVVERRDSALLLVERSGRFFRHNPEKRSLNMIAESYYMCIDMYID